MIKTLRLSLVLVPLLLIVTGCKLDNEFGDIAWKNLVQRQTSLATVIGRPVADWEAYRLDIQAFRMGQSVYLAVLWVPENKDGEEPRLIILNEDLQVAWTLDMERLSYVESTDIAWNWLPDQNNWRITGSWDASHYGGECLVIQGRFKSQSGYPTDGVDGAMVVYPEKPDESSNRYIDLNYYSGASFSESHAGFYAGIGSGTYWKATWCDEFFNLMYPPSGATSAIDFSRTTQEVSSYQGALLLEGFAYGGAPAIAMVCYNPVPPGDPSYTPPLLDQFAFRLKTPPPTSADNGMIGAGTVYPPVAEEPRWSMLPLDGMFLDPGYNQRLMRSIRVCDAGFIVPLPDGSDALMSFDDGSLRFRFNPRNEDSYYNSDSVRRAYANGYGNWFRIDWDTGAIQRLRGWWR